jgi:hypothetical protein
MSNDEKLKGVDVTSYTQGFIDGSKSEGIIFQSCHI